MMMQQTFGISLVAVVLCFQLVLLPERSITDFYMDPTRPRMQLPVASEGTNVNVHYQEEISWAQGRGWVATSHGPIRDEDLEEYLRASVRAMEDRGLYMNVRARIPSDAQAKEFLHLVMCMQRAGVYGFGVAVTIPSS